MVKSNDKIISTLRTACGVSEDIKEFDTDILLAFNSVKGELFQVGIGSIEELDSMTMTWAEWLGNDATDTEIFSLTIGYVSMRVKLLFDPPQPATIKYMGDMLDRHLERLRISADGLDTTEDTEEG